MTDGFHSMVVGTPAKSINITARQTILEAYPSTIQMKARTSKRDHGLSKHLKTYSEALH